MIVGICGFGYTGSGAVLDFLREFDEVSVNENIEMTFTYDPDGLLDLENAIYKNPIRFFSADAGLKKFREYMLSFELRRYMKRVMTVKEYRLLIKKYTDSIIADFWYGFWHFDRRHSISSFWCYIKYIIGGKYLRIYDKLKLNLPKSFPNNTVMYIPVNSECFYENTKRFVSEMMIAMGISKDKPIKVLDQPFPTNAPHKVFQFFDDKCKAIIVKKDPRDMYIFAKEFGRSLATFIPTDNVKIFVDYYRYQMQICELDENTMILNFEDLVYQYGETEKKICDFLGLGNHTKKRKFFDPSISIGNTQVFKKFLKYENDIKYIEKELCEYLYPFEQFGEVAITAETFV